MNQDTVGVGVPPRASVLYTALSFRALAECSRKPMMEHQDETLDCQLKQFCHALVFQAQSNLTFGAFLDITSFKNLLFAQIIKSSCQNSKVS